MDDPEDARSDAVDDGAMSVAETRRKLLAAGAAGHEAR